MNEMKHQYDGDVCLEARVRVLEDWRQSMKDRKGVMTHDDYDNAHASLAARISTASTLAIASMVTLILSLIGVIVLLSKH